MAMSPGEVTKLVKSFWPDFAIHEEVMRRPNSDFMQSFYCIFLSEVEEKVAALINEDNCLDEFADCKEFDQGVYLYARAFNLYKKLNYDLKMFCLSDIYSPTPRRSVFLIRVNTHFAIFINNSLEDLMTVVNSSYEKYEELHHLQVLKQTCLTDVNENAESIARQENHNRKQAEHREIVSREYEQVSARKEIKEKAYAKTREEIAKLKQEIECMEYQIKHFEENEQKLQKQVVTEEYFSALKNTEKCLEDERDRMDVEDLAIDDCIYLKREIVDNLEEGARILQNVNFDHLTRILMEAQRKEQRLESAKFTVKQKKFELMNVQEIEAQTLNEEKEWEEALGEIVTADADVSRQVAAVLGKVKETHEKMIEENSKNCDKYCKLQTNTETVREAIMNLEAEEEETMKLFGQQYRRFLNTSRRTVNHFSKFLSSLIEKDKEICDQYSF